MTARVINDPSLLGWEFDPATGRWTWSGDGSQGGGTGGIPEAPVNGKQYGRQDAGWTEVVLPEGGIADAPADSGIYGRQNNDWVAVPVGGGDSGDGSGGNDPRITDTQISNWDTSYGWGDHSGAGYLTSFTEADPTVPAHVKSISQADINNWNSGTGGGGGGFSGDYNDLTNKPTIPTNNNQLSNGAGYVTSAVVNGYATQSWVGQSYQPKGSYLTASSLNGYATEVWCAQNFVSSSTIGGYYTKTESDARYELKGAGGGGDFVPLSGNSTIAGILTATDFVATSDRNKKDHIETAPTGVIEKLRGVTFQWKDTGKKSSGVVAQELQDAGLGHLVHEDDDGLSVAYAGLTAYLIEEVKALKKELEALKGD